MSTLTVIILTLNEAEDIRRCLDSVKWADEIVVFDCGSEDGTQAICREYTDKLFETDWPGFGPQRNRALREATGDWVLSLDADEWVTEECRDAIKAAIESDHYMGYDILFRSMYCGQILKHGKSRREKHLRLFRRDSGKCDENIVHETLIVDGPIGLIKAPIHHESFKDLTEVLNKINLYSTRSSQQRYRHGKQGGLGKAIRRGIWSFIKTYLLEAQFLNGRAGFMLAVSNAEGTYYRYLKLNYLYENKKSSQTAP